MRIGAGLFKNCAMRIKRLSQEVIDQIAAGEIVERPAHLVKELVENSLDAGARRVDVDFREGGRFVRVQDDGHGMSADEMPVALERFATSKIDRADDLWRLASFGFRGEALASLSAVSKLTLTSRRAEDDQAMQLLCEFGRLAPVTPVGGSFGTSVQIEELFQNLPARLKFLKTEAAEHTQIKVTLKALALSRPDVEFRIHEGGRLIAVYPAVSTRGARVAQVLDLAPLYEGEAQREGLRAHAVFAGPHHVAKSSKNIWLFVQGRWVQDRSMQAAVIEAYRSLLMHGEFPQAVVWLEAESGEVDVNIHPTKSQVKFRDPSLAFRAVQASLRGTLEQAPWMAQSAPVVMREDGHTEEAPPLDSPAPMAGGGIAVTRAAPSLAPMPSTATSFDDPALRATVLPKKYFVPPAAAGGTLRDLGASSPKTTLVDLQKAAERGPWSRLEVLGQAHLTYILCQDDRNLVLVDQHAAHERVAYERLMRAWRGGKIEVQDFLFPLAVDLSPEKVEALERMAPDFAKLGVQVEALGPSTIGVKAGPALLKDGVYAALLARVADEILDQGGSYSFERAVGDLCATMACHSVVRAGQALSLEQMRSLLGEMDEFPLSSFCPHGRPVSVEIPFSKLEKDFGRLV